MDITGLTLGNAVGKSAEIEDLVLRTFGSVHWDAAQQHKSGAVRAAMTFATMVIIENVPPGADRTAAIRKMREAAMTCNVAISHPGGL